jgi:hypothetical protein
MSAIAALTDAFTALSWRTLISSSQFLNIVDVRRTSRTAFALFDGEVPYAPAVS